MGPEVPGTTAVPAAEAAALAWLAGRFPCPRVLVDDDGGLVIEAPTGHRADQPEHQLRPDEVPHLIGRALRRLHDLPAHDCPRERPWAGEVAAVAGAAARGHLDRQRLVAPYDRYPPEELVALLQASPGAGDGAAPVVCHGDPVVTNWWFEAGELVATTGVAGLARADRHLDLAVVYRSLHQHFGPESVYGFLDGYGLDPDLVLLDRYVLLAVLREAIHPDDGPGRPQPPEEPALCGEPQRPEP